ncbi:hypothetical protein PM082_007188 [Marasmius tenuissimus]|nr:hypothetical protein PM082_007188 [Marasmius tenuissimus]
MTTLFSAIMTIPLLIVLLLSPVQGLTIKSRQPGGVGSIGKAVTATEAGSAVGDLSESDVVGFIVGAVVLCLVLIVSYCLWEKKKAKAARKEMEAQMGEDAGPTPAQ